MVKKDAGVTTAESRTVVTKEGKVERVSVVYPAEQSGTASPATSSCHVCCGTGRVCKKVWETPPVVRHYDGRPVHPSIQASIPTQRTIVTVPCPECGGRSTES